MVITGDVASQYDEAAVVEELIAKGDYIDLEERFAKDVAKDKLTVQSELRRLSSFNIRSLQDNDLISVAKNGAYVESSCLDIWSAVANMWISKQDGSPGVVIVTQPTSQAIFQFNSSSEILNNLAIKWKTFLPSPVQYLLLPVNLKNEHWCLLVVNLEGQSAICWDSLHKYDNATFVNSKKAQLAVFLNNLTGKEWKFKNIDLDYELPQQKKNDCGIFCIEFMRAFITGCKSSKEMKNHVSIGTIAAARQHIAKEIEQREILEKHEPVQDKQQKRVRKKSKKVQENDEEEEG